MKIDITTEFIRLDSALKLAGLVESGGQAKFVIQNGEVTLNNEICTQRGKKVRSGDIIAFDGQTVEVSRNENN